MKYSLLLLLFLGGIYSTMSRAEIGTDEQKANLKAKLSALVSATEALIPLINIISDTSKKKTMFDQLGYLRSQVVEESDKLTRTGTLTSHEALSGWKSAFFGLRYTVCEQVGNEIENKREKVSKVRVLTKKAISKKKEELDKLCNQDVKLLANLEIDKTINPILKNITSMIATAKRVDDYINYDLIKEK